MNHLIKFDMIKRYRTMAFLLLVIGLQSHAQTDTINNLLQSARSYQYGINCDVDLNKAKAIYQIAANQNSPVALNALGWLYLKEHGTNRDGLKALRLFETASKMNYPSAMCNLAHMYQSELKVVPQDFKKAYQLYQQAADSNYVKACYWVGYLLYKGFGVEQNYSKAIEYFTKGALNGENSCIYMMGCCNMFGYGMVQNFDSAKVYFNQALKKGVGQVVDIIANNTIDSIRNHPHKEFSTLTDVIKHRFNPAIMPLSGTTFNADSLKGRWIGKLYSYDWSRTIVENEEDIIIELKSNNGTLSGNWYLNGKLITQFQAEQDSQVWKIKTEIQADSLRTGFLFHSIRCKLLQKGDSALLTGNLECIGKKSLEPVRPTYFILDKDISGNVSTVKDTTFVINRIFPNPFNNQFQINFTVIKQDYITFQIHDTEGLMYYTSNKKQYDPGIYSITVNSSLHKGNYNLIAYGEKFVWSQNIIKE